MPGRVRLPEALPKQTACSGHIFPAAPTSAATLLRALFHCTKVVLLHHWFFRPVGSQCSLLLGLQTPSLSAAPFEEHAPLGHGQPEGDKKSNAHNPQSDGIDVEVVQSC